MRTLNRKNDGTFTRPTLAGTFGLGNHICTCGGMNPWKVGIEQEPVKCEHCGKTLDEPYPKADFMEAKP